MSDQPAGVPDDVMIQLDGVGVRYQVTANRATSLKEFAIRALQRDLQTRQFWALHDLDLTVRKGETLGIVGHNGAGKSTLLKVVSRVLHPTTGRVRVRGRLAPLLELGAGFDPELTGRENVYLNGAILGFSRQDVQARFDRIVDFAGLRKFIDAPVRTYSSGMVVRLGFSIATDIQPDVLIVDEVLGVGDAEFQTKSLERIQSFKGAGATFLMVSHSAEVVNSMCDRAIWLDHGQLVQEGPARAVVYDYLKHMATTTLGDDTGSGPQGLSADRRWGNRAIEITAVRFVDAAGNEAGVFASGQPFKIEMQYRVRQDGVKANFGLAIYRHDGVHITGPNTLSAGHRLDDLSGVGVVEYVIDSLSLLDGLYQVSVAVVDAQTDAIFDYHDRVYQFRVFNPQPEALEVRYGMIALPGRWGHGAQNGLPESSASPLVATQTPIPDSASNTVDRK